MAYFKSRSEAENILLQHFHSKITGPGLVLALSKNGIPLAKKLGHELRIPFDLLIVESLGLKHGRFNLGHVIENNYPYILKSYNLNNPLLGEMILAAHQRVSESRLKFRENKDLNFQHFKTILLVDDAILDEKRFEAIIHYLSGQSKAKIIVCTPVILEKIRSKFCHLFEFIFIHELLCFESIAKIYKNFSPVEDQDIKSILNP